MSDSEKPGICQGGCGRQMRAPGSTPKTGVPVECKKGICHRCYRHGPHRMPKHQVEWAIAEARRMREASLI